MKPKLADINDLIESIEGALFNELTCFGYEHLIASLLIKKMLPNITKILRAQLEYERSLKIVRSQSVDALK